MYRIVTRPDFDGLVCVTLLTDVLERVDDVLWLEPYQFADCGSDISEHDVIANLPYHPGASMWFDHHKTNHVPEEFTGAFALEKSAARVVYNYYRAQCTRSFDELVGQADRIDAAELTETEILDPRVNPYTLIALTLDGSPDEGGDYWNWLAGQLRREPAGELVRRPEIARRAEEAIRRDQEYTAALRKYTDVFGNVSVTDFRMLDEPPSGSRFVVFPLFPETNVNVRIRYSREARSKAVVSMGHSVTNPTCDVDVGEIAGEYGGGGHFGAASFSVPRGRDDRALADVVNRLNRREVRV